MEFSIEDGKGTGYKAEVDKSHRLQVRAQSELVIAVKSIDDGDAYQMYLPATAITAGEKNFLYFRNTSETRSFVLNKYFIGWNGGDTNRDRTCVVKQYINAGEPTANATASGAGNLNTGSGNQAALTVFQTSAGASMTQTAGVQAGEIIVDKGTSIFDIQGSTVLAPSDSITIAFNPDETGVVSVTIEGYFA